MGVVEVNGRLIFCVYDTDNDENCPRCIYRGGCRAIGGPFTVRDRIKPQAAAEKRESDFWRKFGPIPEESEVHPEPVRKERKPKTSRPSRLNEATREMVERIRAKQRAKEEAAAQKRFRRDESNQRRKEQARQRQIETELRIHDQNTAESVTESDKTVSRRRPSLTPEQMAQVGAKIEGSVLYRDFCISCGEAIRVVDAGRPNTCLDCKPTGCPGGTRSTIESSGIEYHGGRFNAGEW